ncbi:hypothetical protein HY251_05330 [bacterium]|nr:hypothetical protein [bacterium]
MSPRLARGAALILVIIVIAALVAIAAPFAVSMRLHEKSARGYAVRIKARRLAAAARNDAIAALIVTHQDEERRQRLWREELTADDEDWDSHDELSPRPRTVSGLERLDACSPTGTMIETHATDERGKIDINACGAFPIANLLGATVTTAPLAPDEDKFLPIEDPNVFYSDGDPATLDGIVRVNGEFIGYRHVSHDPPGLSGLVRGMFFTSEPPREEDKDHRPIHAEGSLVQDFRGWKIAWDSVFRLAGTDRSGQLARFETPNALRKIADWEFATFAAARYFEKLGLTLERLKEWGIARESLEQAGLDADALDGNGGRAKETAEQKERRLAAERGLKGLGVDTALIQRFGGDREVLRAWEVVEQLEDPGERREFAQTFLDRARRLEAEDQRRGAYWRTETKRQVESLMALRERSPEVETVSRVELERIRPYITVDSVHGGESWSAGEVVCHKVRYTPALAETSIRVHDARRFRGGPNGSVVRCRARRGGLAEYRRCVNVLDMTVIHHKRIAHPQDFNSVDGFQDQEEESDNTYDYDPPLRSTVDIFPQLDRSYGISELEVQALLPKPINVNAAPREVLVAALTGIETKLFQKSSMTFGKNFVTPRKAGLVADRILAKPVRSHKDLQDLLTEAKLAVEITEGDAEAILMNAVDPCHPLLNQSTVPFCYASGDVYEVRTSGIVNDDAANEVAKVDVREVCQVAPPRDIVWHLDSQADFQDRIYTLGPQRDKEPRRDKRFAEPVWYEAFFPGRRSHLFETYPVDVLPDTISDRPAGLQDTVAFSVGGLSRVSETAPAAKAPLAWQWPRRLHDGGAYAQNAYGCDFSNMAAWIYSEHDPLVREGIKSKDWDNAGAVAEKGPKLEPTRTLTLEDGTKRMHFGPGSFREWLSFDEIKTGRYTLFDSSSDFHDLDRIWLRYITGQSGQEGVLVLQVKDESLDELETIGATLPPAESDARKKYEGRPTVDVRHLARIRQGNWYHVGAAWQGGSRGDGAILLDGYPRGIDQTGTRTTATVDEQSLTIQVLSTAAFPESGYIRLGGYVNSDGSLPGEASGNSWQSQGEVLYYESKTDISFLIAPDPQRWNEILAKKHPTEKGPFPAFPARQTQRGTGHFVTVKDPYDGQPLAVRAGFPHDAGTPVVLWGYTSWVKNGPPSKVGADDDGAEKAPGDPDPTARVDSVQPGSATLLEALPENTPFTLVYKPAPPDALFTPRPACVGPADAEIPVVWAGAYPDGPVPSSKGAPGTTGGFPRSGFLRIGNERVFYDGLAKGRFLKVKRGMDGTLAQTHYLWEPVVLESVHVTSDAGYRDRPTLADPVVHVQLTSRRDALQWMAAADGKGWNLKDPRSEPLVEWLSVMKTGDPAHSKFLLLPAIDPEPGAKSKGKRVALVDAAPGGPVDLPYKSVGDWLGALMAIYAEKGGTLGGSPESLQLQAPAVAPPRVPGDPYVAPIPVMERRQLKEWLKLTEASQSRARKGTAVRERWSQTRPRATSVSGGRLHQETEKVVATFVVGPGAASATGAELWVQRAAAGRGDVVTVTDDAGKSAGREERVVLWVAPATQGAKGATGTDYATGTLVGLDDFVKRVYDGSKHARLVRYPSPQLPRETESSLVAPALERYPLDPPGARIHADATRDELHVTKEPEPDVAERFIRGTVGWPVTPPLDARVLVWADCPLFDMDGFKFAHGLLFRLDDELIAIHPGDIPGGPNLVRGVLGSVPESHGREAAMWWNFPFPRIAIAQSGMTQAVRRLQYHGDELHDIIRLLASSDTETSSSSRPPFCLNRRDFYVGVDRGGGGGILEMLPVRLRHWNPAIAKTVGNYPRTVLYRPRDRADHGCFRGAFGTKILKDGIGHGEVLFDFPFRFHDRYQDREVEPALDGPRGSNEGAFFEATRELSGALLESVTWDAPPVNDCTRIVVAVRMDGAPSWDAQPAKVAGERGRVYVLEDPKGDNRVHLSGERLEIRVWLTFKEDAFNRDGWKQSPILKAIHLTYRQPTRLRRSEERQQ